MVQVHEGLRRQVESEIAKVFAKVKALRHSLHEKPELSWNEVETSKFIAKALRHIPGVVVTEGVGKLGVVGLLDSGKPGPVVALRADMDALPIEEASEVPYRSCHRGIMHACGHDGHMANLLGAAEVLSALKSELVGKVKFIFQPAEEGGRGALVMCDDGVLKNPDVDVIFGLHGWPELDVGKLYFSKGPLMASTTTFSVTVTGQGCHAAMPHLGTDQVLIASRMIDQVQSIVSRRIAPTDAVALTITKFNAGSAVNVIPERANFSGTLRALSEEVRQRVMGEFKQILEGIALAHRVSVHIEWEEGYPATVNDPDATEFLMDVARAVLPAGTAALIPAPTMGGEDFAYFLERVKGAYFFLGMKPPHATQYPSLHHPQYDFNDEALPVGMSLFVHATLAYGEHHQR